MSKTLIEKLKMKDEKTILIQGLPSSIEKQFAKLSFARNLTPLLRSRKIDFALIFAVSENQLNGILSDIMPAFKESTKLWVAYPKLSSKIVTDLNRESSWSKLTNSGFESAEEIALDDVWSAINYKRNELAVFEKNFENPTEQSAEKCLAIEIELPSNLSEEQAMTIIKNIVVFADAQHRSQGGHGLEIKDLRVKQLISTFEEVTL